MNVDKNYSSILTILHISDLHFGKFHYFNEKKDYELDYWIEKLSLILKENEINPNIILITGDFVSTADKKEFKRAENFINEILKNKFDIPIVIVPGNHDLHWAWEDNKIHSKRFDNYLQFVYNLGLIKETLTTISYFKNPHFIHKFPEYSTIILGLNSCLYNVHNNKEGTIQTFDKGYFKEENKDQVIFDIDILRKLLKSIDLEDLNDYKYKIAILHHNILAYKGEGFIKPDPDGFLEILNQKGFKIVLHGHIHKKKINKYQDTILIGAGGFGKTEENKYIANDLNLIKIFLYNSIPGYEIDPLKLVCTTTYRLNYADYQKPITTEMEECEPIEMTLKTFNNIMKLSKERTYPYYIQEFLNPLENLYKFKEFNIPKFSKEVDVNHKIANIDLAKPEDAIIINKIINENYDNTYPFKELLDINEIKKNILSENYKYLVYKDENGRIIGFLFFYIDYFYKKGYIYGLNVEKKYQGIINIIRLAIGSGIYILQLYENSINLWYCENRTAHSSGQFLSILSGLRPIAFLPNKDIFFNQPESEIMHIIYNQEFLRNERTKILPQLIPDLKKFYDYANKVYKLGDVEYLSPNISYNLDLRQELESQSDIIINYDNFQNQSITFLFKNSYSYFRFLFRPYINNIEKVEYKIERNEELYLFISKLLKFIEEKKIRYCEVYLSAYNPYFQKIIMEFGFKPTGYIPSWNYNNEKIVYEDYVLFVYYENKINKKMVLIDENKEFLKETGFL